MNNVQFIFKKLDVKNNPIVCWWKQCTVCVFPLTTNSAQLSRLAFSCPSSFSFIYLIFCLKQWLSDMLFYSRWSHQKIGRGLFVVHQWDTGYSNHAALEPPCEGSANVKLETRTVIRLGSLRWASPQSVTVHRILIPSCHWQKRLINMSPDRFSEMPRRFR